MTDYINREDLIERLKKAKKTIPEVNPMMMNGCLCGLERAIMETISIHAADVVERITAKEVREEDDYWRCSNCKCSLSATMYFTKDSQLILHPNYCPNCGADMRGDDDV